MPPRRQTRSPTEKRHKKLDAFIELAGPDAGALLRSMASHGYVLIPSDKLLEPDSSISSDNVAFILALNYHIGKYKKLKPTQDFAYSMGLKLTTEDLLFTHRSIHTWRLKLRQEGFIILDDPVVRP